MRRSLMGLASCSFVLTAAAAMPARTVGAQMPIPKQYRAEAAAANGGVLPDDPVSEADRRAQRRATDSIAATTPQVTPVMQNSAEISSGGFRAEPFVVPPSSHCTLTGNSESAGRDFEVLVMPSSDMSAWRLDGDRGTPVWRSGRAKAITLDIAVPDAGIYDLVISNRAAWFLTRRITTNVQLSCTGDWPPS